MLSLAETVDKTPVHVFYMGTEAQFLDELESLREPVKDPEHLDFTCCRDTRDLVERLYAYDTPRESRTVVYGLLSWLNSSGETTTEALLRHWSAVLSTGVPHIVFGDTATSPEVENFMSTKL